jgi:vacuolar-type H+-ATPase subunit E/Vma4
VRDFIRRYALTAPQQATAESVLREMQKRRDAYEQSHASDYEAARNLDDRDARRQRFAELNKPVESLFEELKSRVGQIPTTEQRRAVEASAPTSRPARESR